MGKLAVYTSYQFKSRSFPYMKKVIPRYENEYIWNTHEIDLFYQEFLVECSVAPVEGKKIGKYCRTFPACFGLSRKDESSSKVSLKLNTLWHYRRSSGKNFNVIIRPRERLSDERTLCDWLKHLGSPVLTTSFSQQLFGAWPFHMLTGTTLSESLFRSSRIPHRIQLEDAGITTALKGRFRDCFLLGFLKKWTLMVKSPKT